MGRIFQPWWSLLNQVAWTEKFELSNLRMHIADFFRVPQSDQAEARSLA